MKKFFMFLCLMGLIAWSQAQTIVSTTISNKNALIEEFTGIHCGYCPLGHLSLANAMAANPGHVYGIAYHQGSYATPNTGEPDYRTTYGDAIANQTGLTGYPAGTVSRHIFSGGITDYAYSSWGTGCNTITSQTAPVNIAISVSLNYSTRVLTVLVEAYYTSSSAASTNYLNVAILQNNIKGPQSNYGNYNPTQITSDGKYMHQHMLREMLTGQWGATISTTTAGTFYTQTYNYTVPASINSITVDPSELEVVAFITQSTQEVLNCTGATVAQPTLDASVSAVSGINSVMCAGDFTPVVTLKNKGTSTLTSATINYKTDAGTVSTYNWTGSLANGATTNITLPTQNVLTGGSHTFYAYTTYPNGGTDLNAVNDQTTVTFTTYLSKIVAPVTEPFTNTGFSSTNWLAMDAGNDAVNWVRSTQGHAAAGSAFINFYNSASGQADDIMFTPLDFTYVTNASLSFYLAYRQYNTGTTDQLQVDISTNCGSTWTTLWSQNGSTLATGAATTSAFTAPTTAEWTQKTVSLAAYNGNPNLLLRIRAVSDYGNNLFLDDINLTGTTSAPAQPSVISGTTTSCMGTNGLIYSVTAQTGVTYTWTVPTGWTIVSGQGTNSISVNVGASASSGNISVTPSNAGGNGTARTLAVTANPNVTPAVTIALTAGTNPMCSGSSATFTATPANGGTPSYQWQINGVNAGSNSSTFNSSTLTNGQVITCIMNSSAACASPASVTSSGITMTVNPVVTPAVSIAQTAGTNPMCAGASATFTATPTNGGTPTYQWTVNGSNVGTGSTYTTTGLTDGQTVSCVMTSTATCASPATGTSNNIVVAVNSTLVPDVTIALASGTTTICAGTSVTFNATPVNGGTAPSYQWQVNGANAGTGSTFNSSTLTDGQSVTCIMTSNSSCASPTTATSTGITMTVNPTVVPAVVIALTAGTNPACQGSSMTFTATPSNEGTAPSYQWQVNGANAGTGNTFTTTSLTNGQNVSCILTSNATCATPATATSAATTVTINALPPAPVISQNINDLTSSYPTGNQWYNTSGIMAGETGQTLNVTADGNYYAVYTDGNSCSSAPSNTINVIYTGIEDHSSLHSSLMPNPTNGMVTVTFSTTGNEPATVAVINPQGAILMQQEVNGVSEISLDLSRFANGIYMIRIQSGNEAALHRVVLQK